MKTKSEKMHELYMLNKKEEEEKVLTESFLKKKEEEEKANAILESYNKRSQAMAKRNAVGNFLTKLKPSLVVESINYIVAKSMPYATDKELQVAKGLVNQYVKENGGEEILSKFKTTSYILSEYASVIDDTFDKIRERCINEEEDLTIEPEERDEFFDNLDTQDAEEVSMVIRTRVANATEEFIEKNAEDKMNIKDVLMAAQQKIDAEPEEDIRESYDSMAKRKVQHIKDNRPKGIYEYMVYKLANKSFKDDSLNKQYVCENKLDMDSITTDVEVLYTVMETLNTLKIQKFDIDYVNESVINNF